MKRRQRGLAIFNLSALDVLAMATGTFVLIVVILMPFYRKSFDAHAEIEDVRVASAELEAQVESIRNAAAADQRAASSARAEASEITEQASSALAAAASRRDETEALSDRAGEAERLVASLESQAEQRVIEELDLVFVVDTTASMANVLRDMALSMAGIVRVLERLVPSLRVGFVAYRDHDFRDWVVRSLPLTPTDSGLAVILDFAHGLRPPPRGGRTTREAVRAGLEEAVRFRFRPEAKQIIIIVGDAAPHRREEGATLAIARQFVAANPRRSVSPLFVTTKSYLLFGTGDREFFAALARAGAGEFTDHKGQMMESVLLSVLEE